MLRVVGEAARDEATSDAALEPVEPIEQFEGDDLDWAPSPISQEAERLISEAEKTAADQISRLLGQAMAAKSLAASRPFSPEMRELLRSSWALAGLLQSRMVTPLHVFASLSTGKVERAAGLAQVIGAEPKWVFAGTVVRASLLRTAPQPSAPGHLAAPTIDLLRWIAEASAYSERQSASAAHLEPDDLVSVLSCQQTNPRVKQRIKELLREAANLGREPAEFVMTRHGVENAHMTVRYFRSDTRETLKDIQKGVGSLGGEVKALTGTLEAINHRLAAATTAGQAGAAPLAANELAALGGTLRDDLAQIEERQAYRLGSTCRAMHEVVTATSADQVGLLTGIDQRTAAIEQKLPVPPTGHWLTAAVAAVISLGVLAGLLLSTGSR